MKKLLTLATLALSLGVFTVPVHAKQKDFSKLAKTFVDTTQKSADGKNSATFTMIVKTKLGSMASRDTYTLTFEDININIKVSTSIEGGGTIGETEANLNVETDELEKDNSIINSQVDFIVKTLKLKEIDTLDSFVASITKAMIIEKDLTDKGKVKGLSIKNSKNKTTIKCKSLKLPVTSIKNLTLDIKHRNKVVKETKAKYKMTVQGNEVEVENINKLKIE